MAVGLYVLENVLNPALRTNDKRSSGDAPHFLAVHVLLLHHAEGLGNFLFGIGQKREGQVLALLELLLCLRSVRGYPKQHGARLLHLLV